MFNNVRDAFARLDQIPGQLTLPVLMNWFSEMPFEAEDVADYMIFSPDRYVRNLLHQGPLYQALVLCWRNGQRSPIHNHRGSNCGVKVLRGVATETLFRRAPNGMMLPTASRELPCGHTCASVDEDTHQVSNLQSGGADLVTLHIYSPPLLRMEMYSLESPVARDWYDPINEYGSGI